MKLCSTHCNADCERLFSIVRRNQTEFRPNMSAKLIESLSVMKASSIPFGNACFVTKFDNAFLKKAKSATSVGLKADKDI